MKKHIIFLSFLILATNFLYSQNKIDLQKLPQCRSGYVQLTFDGGFLQPLGIMGDRYYPSGNGGFDFAVRVNTEIALFTEGRYNFLINAAPNSPDAGWGEWTVGPRYYFVSKYVKSIFFWEAATGMYLKHESSYIDQNDVTIDGKTEIHMGANGGVGAELYLTDAVYFTVKAKYNTIFGTGGSNNFLSGYGGLTFKFK
jgi:hypothetical protein